MPFTFLLEIVKVFRAPALLEVDSDALEQLKTRASGSALKDRLIRWQEGTMAESLDSPQSLLVMWKVP